jgi:hypothetical protein
MFSIMCSSSTGPCPNSVQWLAAITTPRPPAARHRQTDISARLARSRINTGPNRNPLAKFCFARQSPRWPREKPDGDAAKCANPPQNLTQSLITPTPECSPT